MVGYRRSTSTSKARSSPARMRSSSSLSSAAGRPWIAEAWVTLRATVTDRDPARLGRMTPSFDNLLLVMAVAFAAPLVLGLFPRLQLPSVVVEIILGIVIGPSVLGFVHVDESVQVVSVIGLAFVLF